MTIESKGTYVQSLMDTVDFIKSTIYYFIRLDVPRLVTTILSASEQYELKYRSKGIEEGISPLHRL